MTEADLYRIEAERSASLFDLPAHVAWSPADLGPILEHQLAAPLEPDLATLATTPGSLRKCLAEQRPPVRTFAELLHHPAPALELLDQVKQLAKAHRASADPVLPPEVATVLYYTTLAVALARHGQRLSQLDPATLRDGFTWTLALEWLPALLRPLLQAGQAALE